MHERNEIVISHDEKNIWTVKWGDCTHDKLTWDEMLGQVVCLTLNGRSYFPVHTGFHGDSQDKGL